VPPVIGKIAMRSVMERQFDAMVVEIQARERDRVQPP
ncbi:MAG: cyclase, partial [Proteobacteria bacterium]|nr:cyclase [Pseudomonadota bacterium]